MKTKARSPRAKQPPDAKDARHAKKKQEFSKGLLVVVGAVMLILSVIDVIYIFTHDSYSSALNTLLELWSAILTACITFYFWKAKNENVKKHGQNFYRTTMNDLCDKYGPEKAVPLIEAMSTYLRAVTDGK